MIDHVGLGVTDLEQSKAFYQQALGPLGYQLLMERDGSAGFGATATSGQPGTLLAGGAGGFDRRSPSNH